MSYGGGEIFYQMYVNVSIWGLREVLLRVGGGDIRVMGMFVKLIMG